MTTAAPTIAIRAGGERLSAVILIETVWGSEGKRVFWVGL